MEEAKQIHLEIATPQRLIFQGDVLSVTVPGTKGPFQILWQHAPIISTLEPGLVKVVNSDGSTFWYAVSNGFVNVQNNQISVCVEHALAPEEIDINKVEKQIDELRRELKEAKSDRMKEKISFEISKFKAYKQLYEKVRK